MPKDIHAVGVDRDDHDIGIFQRRNAILGPFSTFAG